MKEEHGIKYFKIIVLAIKTLIKRFKKTKINIFTKPVWCGNRVKYDASKNIKQSLLVTVTILFVLNWTRSFGGLKKYSFPNLTETRSLRLTWVFAP